MLEIILSLITAANLSIFAISLALAFAVKSWLSHPKGLPPSPCLPLPLAGHIFFMTPTAQKAFMRWTQKMGDIFTIYMGSTPNIVINSYDLLHEAFVKKADIFSHRPSDFRMTLWPDSSKGIVFNSGHSWREQRNISISILKTFGMGKNWLADNISDEVEAYVSVLRATPSETKDVFTLTNKAVANVISAILFGERFEYNNPDLIRFLKVSEDIIKIAINSSALNIFPVLRFLPGDLFDAKKFVVLADQLSHMFSDHYIQKFKDEDDDTSKDNYIKAYLREMRKRQEEGEDTYLDERNLRRNIDDLFMAGSETTSTTILWSMVYAMNYPEVQNKVHKEIDDAVGRDRTPTLEDRSSLAYLNAFILETQRLASIAPFGAFHVCTETTQLGGYTIPAGAVVTPHLYAILMDEKTWKDPQTFRPERFLDKDNKVVIPKEFLPFSMGKRSCLGEALVKMELFLFLSAIYQRFEIYPEQPDCLPSMEPEFGSTLRPKRFRVILKERL